jgi:hypothetical protein
MDSDSDNVELEVTDNTVEETVLESSIDDIVAYEVDEPQHEQLEPLSENIGVDMGSMDRSEALQTNEHLLDTDIAVTTASDDTAEKARTQLEVDTQDFTVTQLQDVPVTQDNTDNTNVANVPNSQHDATTEEQLSASVTEEPVTSVLEAESSAPEESITQSTETPMELPTDVEIVKDSAKQMEPEYNGTDTQPSNEVEQSQSTSSSDQQPPESSPPTGESAACETTPTTEHIKETVPDDEAKDPTSTTVPTTSNEKEKSNKEKNVEPPAAEPKKDTKKGPVNDAFKLFRTTMALNSLARNIKSRYRQPAVQTALPTANYGTSFAMPVDQDNSDIYIPPGTMLPANIYLADKPSIASPHVMAPVDRNVLFGRRLNAVDESDGAKSPAMAAAKAPSGTTTGRKPTVVRPRGAINSAASLESQNPGHRRRSSSSSSIQGPSKAGDKVEEIDENLNETARNPEMDDNARQLPPQPVTRIDIIKRDLPERGFESGRTPSPERDLYEEESSLPFLLVHKPSFDGLYENVIQPGQHPDGDYSALPSPDQQSGHLVLDKPSLIPRPTTKQKSSLEIIPVLLDEFKKDEKEQTEEKAVDFNAEEEGIQSKTEVNEVEAKKKTKKKKIRKHMALSPKHHITVLTKSGLEVEGTSLINLFAVHNTHRNY